MTALLLRSALAAGLLVAAAPLSCVRGQPEGPACERFAWSLEREKALFSTPELPRVQSGGAMPRGAEAALIQLRPPGEIDLPIAVEKAPKPGTFGAVVTIEAPVRPGIYQITLSEEAWVDVSQDRVHPLSALGHTGRRSCPGLRKSVRFDLKAEPVLVQITGAETETMKLAISPAR